MNEREKLRLIGQGKTEYLEDIARDYYDDIYRFCRFETGDRELAYDLTQETFLRFIRYAEHYRGGNIKGYLLTIAMNVCRDHWNREGRRKALDIREQDWDNVTTANQPDEKGVLPRENSTESVEANAADERLVLQEALLALPDFQREAIVLHYYYEMKYREIAKLTGTNTSTVKSRIRQGCQKLKELLDEK